MEKLDLACKLEEIDHDDSFKQLMALKEDQEDRLTCLTFSHINVSCPFGHPLKFHFGPIHGVSDLLYEYP